MSEGIGERELSSEDQLEYEKIVAALRRHQRDTAKRIADLQRTKAKIDRLLAKLEESE